MIHIRKVFSHARGCLSGYHCESMDTRSDSISDSENSLLLVICWLEILPTHQYRNQELSADDDRTAGNQGKKGGQAIEKYCQEEKKGAIICSWVEVSCHLSLASSQRGIVSPC